MSVTRTRRGPSDITGYLVLGAALVIIAGAAALWAAVHAGAALDHIRPAPPGNPAAIVLDLVTHKERWPGAWATSILVGEVVVLAALGTLAALGIRSLAHRQVRVDAAARHMADRREVSSLSRAAAEKSAARLGAPVEAPGVPFGTAVGSGIELFGGYEYSQVDVTGTRRGKTTARAIPAIITAPGAAVVTSNKRDIVDATRGVRKHVGAVALFDPQSLATQDPEMWWNPLSYVTDVEKAVKMAACFAAYARDAGAHADAFFDPSGRELTAWLLLAAAVAKYPITRVYTWVSDQSNTEPVDILRAAGHDLPADSVEDVIRAPDKQRGGIYATAKLNLSCLVNPRITRWVTPNDKADEFHPEQFVRGGHPTLYLLSKEGLGTAGALVTALTMAVFDAAEEYASTLPYGRLQVPLLACLDEAANVCRISTLPELYSHYGSRGIILMTFLQTWTQGVKVWGEEGMKIMWSAANLAVYGGGNREVGFLQEIKDSIGQFEPTTSSYSRQRGSGGHWNRSYSEQTRPEDILDVADLIALPFGRAILLASGTRPILFKPRPWMDGPHADAVRASLAEYEPTGERERRTAGESEYRAAELAGAEGPR
jgi:type IV secretory pathway TraG/TraD family ATPase VirD4